MTPVRPYNQCLMLLVLVAGLWFSGLLWFTHDIKSMSTPPLTPKLDAIVVLTGGSNRLQEGFDLLAKGYGQKLFISGVYRGVEVKELMALWKKEDAERLACCVILGDAQNTIGNAQETVAWLNKEGFHSLYLVTANYHMRRALIEFRNITHDLEIYPWPVQPEKTDMENWWKDNTTRILIVREYSKYLFSLVRYAITL